MSAAPHLSPKHQQMLFEGSGNDPAISAERGVRTIAHGHELPAGFSPRQKRLGSGLLFTVHRPNGETSYSFRPDKPDKPGRKYEQPSKHHGGPGNVLDVHPSLHRLIADTSVPVIYVEGIKKADSITTAARAAGVEVLVVAISGVWNFLSEGKPIPDLLEIPVEGREVGIIFDDDVLINQGVQGAAVRLAETEIGRGASVRLAYLPGAADGSKVGADDFLVSGKTYAELRMTMRAYDPGDFEVLRLTRDDKLRAAVGYLWRRWYEGDWLHFKGHAKRGNWARGYTAYDTTEALIELATRGGKVDERGVVVRVGLRKLAEMAAKSAPSVGKAVAHLEADGQLEILPPEGKGKPRSYRLLVPRAALYSMERGDAEEKNSEESDRRCKGLRAPTAPRLRWSSPGRKVKRLRGVVPGTSRVRETPRFSKGLTVRESVAEFPDRPYVKRLGPARGAVLDALEAAGGALRIENLCELLHRKRPRDVRRRVLKPLEEAGIIECEGDVVRLAADWLAKLEEERERKGEVSQAGKQAEDHRKQGERYRDYLESVKTKPSAAGLAAVKRSQEKRAEHLVEHEEHQVKVRAAELEHKRFVKRFVHDRVKSLGCIRLGLLQEILRDAGGTPSYALPAAKSLGCTVEKLPEYGDREFVFAPQEWAAA